LRASNSLVEQSSASRIIFREPQEVSCRCSLQCKKARCLTARGTTLKQQRHNQRGGVAYLSYTANMVSTITTVGGYVAIVVGGGLYWYYVSNRGGKGTPRRRPSLAEKQEQVKQTGKSKRRASIKADPSEKVAQLATDAKEVVSSALENVKNVGESVSGGRKSGKKDQKKGKAQSPKSAAATGTSADTAAATTSKSPGEKDRGADDHAFAAQLAKTQRGTNLQAPEKNKQRVKTTKQGKANKVAEELSSNTSSSTAPSTTGADADDGRSSHVASPEPNATSDPTGVADMIAPSTSGPLSLRITPSEKQQQQKPKHAKKEQEVETKKQRQRRQKNEERKAQAAEDERQRKALLERQMKTARTLDGTAKSHISKFNAPPSSNAWKGGEGSASNQMVEVPAESELLDTFDTAPVTEAPSSLNERAPTANGNGNGETTGKDLSMSESTGEWEKIPDQLLDDGWENATSKKSKKNKKKGAASSVSDSA
jgi:hypothetical protein